MAERRERTGDATASTTGSAGIVALVLAPVAIACSLMGATNVYQTLFPLASEQEATPVDQVAQEQPAQENTYQGVEDPWVSRGYFTIGDAEIDQQIKEFCDAFSGGSDDAAIAAQTVYNNVCWSNYTPREAGQKPQGRDWILVSARLYFDSARPEEGEAGDGDYYEYSAALSLCLRYFGYTYVNAFPIVRYDDWGNEDDSAICFVVDEAGNRYVCDPSQGTYGWMLDAATQDILVDNIGQDLTDANNLGLPVIEVEQTGEVSSEYAWDADADYTDEYADEYFDEYAYDDAYA